MTIIHTIKDAQENKMAKISMADFLNDRTGYILAGTWNHFFENNIKDVFEVLENPSDLHYYFCKKNQP
jgi:hypothetical protein